MRTISTTPHIDELIAANAPIAIGVSGGKDGDTAGFVVTEELDRRGHTGPRILIHADLGRVEWDASLPQCQRLADRLGLELVVVRRTKGDMMDRWLQRWQDNVQRYIHLECVKVILPWSTASMRFCTSELKTSVICAELVRRFPNTTILSVAGIRREESAARAKAQPQKLQKKLISTTHNTTGYTWLPILDWTLDEVRALHGERNFPMHTTYQTNSRVSCRYCILASQADLLASTTWDETHPLYREMVDLEIRSTFAFQDAGWLGDLAPQLLSVQQQAGLADAKRRAAERMRLEAEIPQHLLYEKQWPRYLPTHAEAQQLARIRQQIGALLDLPVLYTDAASVRARFRELMQAAGRAPVEYEGMATLRQLAFV